MRYPADQVVSAIEAGQVLSIKEVHKGSGWVSDELEEVVREWDYNRPGLKPPVLINAPTGRGKNTFVQNVLAEHAAKQGRYVLLLTNRYTLNLQQKQNFSSSSNHPPFGTAMIENVKVFGHIICLLYHEVLGSLDWIIRNYSIGFVVFDEVHFFCSDATFNVDTGNILRKLLQKFFCVKRIYMSATPEDVKWLIAHEEYNLCQWLKNPYDTTHPWYSPHEYDNNRYINQWSGMFGSKGHGITEYIFARDYSFVNIHFFNTWDNLKEIIQEHDASEKWLIFVSSKDDGKKLSSSEEGIKSSEFIDASYKDLHSGEIRKMAFLKKFNQKVLIATTVLYNGFSFEDDELKNIVVDSIDRIEVLQMLGRKRLNGNETINLFVLEKTRNDIATIERSCMEKAEILQEFSYDCNCFNNYRLGTLTESQQHLFKINQGYIVGINSHAPYQLACVGGKCQAFEKRFIQEGDTAFFNEVCSWFGMRYAPEMGENLKEKIRKRVVDFTEERVGHAMTAEEFEIFREPFMAIIEPIIPQINAVKKQSIRNDKRHPGSGINNAYKFLQLPYKCKKANNLWTVTKIDGSLNDLDDDSDNTGE